MKLWLWAAVKGGIMGDDARKRTAALSVRLSDGEEEDGRREER